MDFVVMHFQESLILALLLTLFFKESLTEFMNAKLGIIKKKEKVPEWGSRLIQYANHDTTEKLNEVIRGQDSIKEAMYAHNKLDERIIVLLEEQKEYGVKIRRE